MVLQEAAEAAEDGRNVFLTKSPLERGGRRPGCVLRSCSSFASFRAPSWCKSPYHRHTEAQRRSVEPCLLHHEGHRGHGGSLEGELSVLRALSGEPSGTWRGEPVPTVRRLFYRRPRRKRRRVLRRVCFVSSCLRGSKILLLLPLPIRAIRVIRGKTIPTVRRWFYRSRGRRGCFATKEHMERKGAPSL
jgi:hypothetical protein